MRGVVGKSVFVLPSSFLLGGLLNATLPFPTADPTDYVNPVYVVQQSQARDPSTSDAQKNIISRAPSSRGPFSDFGSSSNDSDFDDDSDPGLERRHFQQNRMIRYRRALTDTDTVTTAPSSTQATPTTSTSNQAESTLVAEAGEIQAPFMQPPFTAIPPIVSEPSTATTTNTFRESGYPEAAAKPKQSKQSSCTPSPTRHMEPSATWTTCPYITRDGKVNPDTRTLHGPAAANDFSQALQYNSIAYGLTNNRAYSQAAVQFVKQFFIDPSTRMNPNVNYGQVTFEASSSTIAGWDLVLWPKRQSLDPTTMAPFFACQRAAIKMAIGDQSGAKSILQDFFSSRFREQIAKNGEQPFEAVRANPYHYRAFNLEALTTCAKLGDALELDFWTAKSKYDATIKNAIDWAMNQDPKNENPNVLVSSVMLASTIYGDEDGKYAAWLRRVQSDYKRLPAWFFDQRSAFNFGSSPRARRDVESADAAPAIERPFVCPEIFAREGDEVELDPGVFVRCEDVAPLFEELETST
ncbi:hypothetical protein D9758_000132 [Tetrapyrgos nigripes]|uniref:Alginate lyase domain-containing protein n=1 Tax=Tetrapyrgos nigripes TaxID=182062 RepID=A0A8H5H1Q2_9AGAR|nr:hypothetical protein D9758_000132 [Tetrapyrgos nigripes]